MKGLKGLLIETQVDKLIKLVRRRGKLTVSQAAVALGVEERKIEEWVGILEEHGFVELRYPAIGEPEIILKEIPPEKVIERGEEFEKRKEKIEEKAEKYEKKIGEVEEKVEVSDKEFLELKEELQNKLKFVERDFKRLKQVERRGRGILREALEIEEVSKRYDEHFRSAKNTIKEMDKRINEHLENLKGHEIDVKKLEKTRNLIENEIIALDKEISILRSLVKKPITIPILRIIKSRLKTHKKRSRKIRKKRKKLKKKVSKVRKVIKKRGKIVKKRELNHKKRSRRVRKKKKKLKRKVSKVRKGRKYKKKKRPKRKRRLKIRSAIHR